MVTASPLHPSTVADLASLPPNVRAEVINGEVVEKANPSAEHADAQGGALTHLRGLLRRCAERTHARDVTIAHGPSGRAVPYRAAPRLAAGAGYRSASINARRAGVS